MAFTIAQTFDLLFGQSRDAGAATYDSRRWFRRPGKARDGTQSDDDAQDAEAFLVAHIRNRSKLWAEDIGEEADRNLDAARDLPPRQPYDVFAIAAYLVENAGIYHHIQPVKVRADGAKLAPDPDLRHIDITAEDRRIVADAAEAWRSLVIPTEAMAELARTLVDGPTWSKLEPLFESWWVVFKAFADRLVGERPIEEKVAILPPWWKHAWRLLAIADEAASATGFIFDVEQLTSYIEGRETDVLWFEGEVLMEHALQSLANADVDEDGVTQAEFPDINTFSVASPSVLNVLPKVRTPSVGCTLRSISHHLALLPPTGVVRARWTPNYKQRPPEPGSMPRRQMNLLLVPLPYSLGARSFEPALIEDVSGGPPSQVPKFGYFDVIQDWLDPPKFDRLLSFVNHVIEGAQAQSKKVHGLVFPELALDRDSFDAIRTRIRELLPEAEILIAGVSVNEHGRKGNFVATATFPGEGADRSVESRQTIREKHHRWKLDKTQLRDYGLLGTLSPELSWWENISLQARQVNFTVMRKDSVFAAMICEDLARVDPCQQVIRAIGPNLVVALLMDAPQIEARWPARYATVLAEDPGCAALTMTSRGLMTLQHRLGTYRSNGDDRVIGLWRDDGATKPVSLKCPYDSQAVLLTIVEEASEDIALDGRVDMGAKAWRYVGHVPIRVAEAKKLHPEVLGPEDMACW